ncbi:MAG: TerB family tellurite resistance protein [Calditrichaeota bacterium]|nr:TerB family tellurite resistance protein [Calditrichota bacterium]
MGFWGKAIGAGMGFMVGGPIGAIIGGAIGHTFDAEENKRRYFEYENNSWPEVEQEFDRQYLFYVSLASLAAKMAKADGVVTTEEIRAFDQFLRVELGLNVDERKNIATIFNEAKNSPEEATAIAMQFKQLIGFQYDVLDMMIRLLFKIALADGELHPSEETFIKNIAAVFGISQAQFMQIRALYFKESDRAYQILGVSRSASNDEIKKAYRSLVREYHPDKIQAKGVPEDFMKVAHEKMAEINQAYDQIRKERGI